MPRTYSRVAKCPSPGSSARGGPPPDRDRGLTFTDLSTNIRAEMRHALENIPKWYPAPPNGGQLTASFFLRFINGYRPVMVSQSVSPDRTYPVRKQNMPWVPWRAWFSASGCAQGLIPLVLVAVVRCAFNRRVLTPSVMSDSFPSRPWAPAYRCRPTEGLADSVGSQKKKGNGRICRNNGRVLTDK